jgi:hypothetical protein
MLWGGSVYALYRYVVRRDTHPHTLYWVVISPLFLRHLFQISLYSPDNDLMILIVGVILCGLLLEILLENSPTPASRYRLVVGAAWLGLGLTFKLSFGMIGGWVYLMMWAVQAFRSPSPSPNVRAGRHGGGVDLRPVVGAWGVAQWLSCLSQRQLSVCGGLAHANRVGRV